jgi:hypothetical protein
VERDPEELRFHDAVLREGTRELLLLEAGEPRPEADVRRLRPLRLDRADPFHRLLNAELAPLEQELPSEQCAVQLASSENAIQAVHRGGTLSPVGDQRTQRRLGRSAHCQAWQRPRPSVNMGDVDPHAWFTGEELAPCPDCGERGAIPVLANRSVLCLACGSVTSTEGAPEPAESEAAIDGVGQSQQHY